MVRTKTTGNTSEDLTGIISKKKIVINIAIHSMLAVAVLIIAPWFGSENFTFSKFSAQNEVFKLLLSYRLARVTIAFLLGGVLSLSGTLLQATLKNPLIEPYTLGISSSSALGAFIGITFFSFIPWSGFSLSILISVFIIFTVYRLSQRFGGFSVYTLILAGITISIFSASLISLLRYILNPLTANLLDRWLIGSLITASWKDFWILLCFSIPLILWGGYFANDYNQLYFQTEVSKSRGLNVEWLQKITFLIVSIAIAGSVSLFGPIAFVGLIVPHIERKISGFDYRIVIPATFISGGILLTLSDLISRTILAPTELPVGIITSCLGAPFFLYLLFCRKDLTD
ncbi:MAG: hypothetical protein APR63_01180 [Desulfuromonas sp. SDB]|nr:MAG: hypothetical protein APR63_01180 [Desulfuromonas sp. SDB]